MANNCWYQMRIAGKKESVDQFMAMLSGKAPTRLGRVFSVNKDEPFTPYPGNRSIFSMKRSMRLNCLAAQTRTTSSGKPVQRRSRQCALFQIFFRPVPKPMRQKALKWSRPISPFPSCPPTC